MASHVSAIAPADLEQRLRDLAERADAHGVHQHFEDIAVGDHGVAQTLEHRWRILGVALLKFREALELRLLFVVRSEEHTSELQSLMRISYAVFCLKKKTQKHAQTYYTAATR